MNRQGEIILHLESVDQLIEPRPPSPFLKRRMGSAFGFIGILLASPLAAAVMILVKMVYVEDVLGDQVMRVGCETEKERSNGERTGDAVGA